ncbi:MAG: hypothetical protein WCT23_09095 [Candidatus Neomarinimicrobiota bacterium]
MARNGTKYLNIPDVEKLVAFPNFATVLLQHAREVPQKSALKFENSDYTYLALTKFCSNIELPEKKISLSMRNIKNDLLLLLACLYQGKQIDLNFNRDTNLVLDELKIADDELKYFEPPYVKLDDPALILNDTYHFTQYKVLLAAKAVGNALHLFRDGASYCPAEILSIKDLLFAVLAPLFFAKSIEFTFNKEINHYHYAWNRTIDSDLRDCATVFFQEKRDNNYTLKESFDQAMGLGPLFHPSGSLVELLGYELFQDNGTWRISGHGIAREEEVGLK